MQKPLLFILLLVLIFLVGCTQVPPAKEELVVGAILPLTGDIAFVGTSIQQGIEIAVEGINQTGGINGKLVRVIFEDDKYDNAASVTAANKLIASDKIDVGIIGLVHGAKAVAPVFEQNKIPLVVAWDSTKEIETGEYVFSTGFSTEAAGEKMAQYAFSTRNLRKVAIVLHQDEWSEIIAPAFKQEFERLGGQVVLEEKIPVGETDFKTVIEKIKQANVDGAYFPLVPVGSDVFIKQTKELDLNVVLLSGDALIPDIIAAAGEAAENIYFTNIYAEDNTVSQALVSKYREKFGQEPEALPMVAFGYDSMLAIKKAIETTTEPTSESIKTALYSVDILGAGGEIKIRPNGLSERAEKVFKVENGQAVSVE